MASMTDEAVQRGGKHRSAIVQYNGESYVRNLALCRRALTHRQVEGEFLGGVAEMATVIDCSRSTVHRFFRGRNVSTEATTKILAGLHLRFDEVHTLVPEERGPFDDHR